MGISYFHFSDHLPGEAELVGSPLVFFVHMLFRVPLGWVTSDVFLSSNQQCQSTEGNKTSGLPSFLPQDAAVLALSWES